MRRTAVPRNESQPGESQTALEIITRLRGAGKRLTPQREQLLHLLDSGDGPLDANALYLRAQHAGLKLSLSTVYRTLQVLVDLGAVTAVDLGDNHTHYAVRRASEAHHLVCEECSRVIQFDSPLVQQLCETLARDHQFVLKDLHLVLRGHCDGDPTECPVDHGS